MGIKKLKKKLIKEPRKNLTAKPRKKQIIRLKKKTKKRTVQMQKLKRSPQKKQKTIKVVELLLLSNEQEELLVVDFQLAKEELVLPLKQLIVFKKLKNAVNNKWQKLPEDEKKT